MKLYIAQAQKYTQFHDFSSFIIYSTYSLLFRNHLKKCVFDQCKDLMKRVLYKNNTNTSIILATR